MSGSTNIPAPNTPFLDKSGQVSLIWRRFLTALLNRTGGTNAEGNALLNGNANEQFAVQTAASPTSAVPLAQYRSQAGQAPSAVAVTGSPFTFTAPANGFLVVSGGTVSNVEFQRGGVQATIGSPPEIISMRFNDQVIVAYSSSPGVIWFPD